MKSLMNYGLSLLLVATSLFASAQQIGLQLYSLRNQIPKDVPGSLALVSKWGIKEIEGGGTYGLTQEEFNALCKKNNLKMISIGVGFDELEKDPAAVAAKAKQFGAKYVMCSWIPHTGDDFTLADTEKAISVFSNAGKVLTAQGISFCYHIHGYEFRPYEDGTLFDLMVRKLDAQYVNFEMDVFWVKHPGQDPVALLKKYPGRFPLMHLKDRKPGTPDSQSGHADVETNVVLGTGDVGIKEIMKIARQVGVKHFFIEDESSYAVEQIPQSLTFLKSLK
ncbi:MAG: sugar phosphate isomerase/epimerase [Cyclobacteriaceae bacterium]|nr:sugar phosphate isomerase/epimerase [Cyclobacteriaceae bacterium]